MAKDLIRRRKKRGYTIIDNQPINNSNLKYEDIGLLVYVLSKPDDWVIYKKELVSSHQNGRESVAGILKRLEANGYLQIIPHRDPKGRFSYNEYVFTDVAWEFEDEIQEPMLDQQFNHEREAVYGNPLTANRIRETVNGNPAPTNTIYTNLEEEEEERQDHMGNLAGEENCLEDISGVGIELCAVESNKSMENNYDLKQEMATFQRYTAINIDGDARKNIYLKWRKEWGFSSEMILKAAQLMCQLARQPNLSYLDQVLHGWKVQNISTIEEADSLIKNFKSKKQQRYNQKAIDKVKNKLPGELPYSEYELYVPPEINKGFK